MTQEERKEAQDAIKIRLKDLEGGQKLLALACHVSTKSIRNALNGSQSVRFETLKKIDEKLNVLLTRQKAEIDALKRSNLHPIFNVTEY